MDSGPKILLLAMAIPIVLCCGGGYVMLSGIVDAKSRHAKEFGDQVVRKVTGQPSWDAEALRGFGSMQYQKQYSAAELEKTVTDGPAKTLGAFVKGVSRARITHAADKDGSGTLVDYENMAEFTKGKARVKLELTEDANKKWSVSSFSVLPL